MHVPFYQTIKQHLKLSKRSLIFIGFGLMLLILALFFYSRSDSRRFHRLKEDIFCSAFQYDSLSLHYFLKDPQDFNLRETPVTLPVYDTTVELEKISTLKSQISNLESIRPQNLTAENQKTYDALLCYMRAELSLSQYDFFYEPLSPALGLQSQFPILLAEYQFQDVKDIDAYLEILTLLPTYFESLIQYEKQKSEAGMFMTDHSCKQVIEQCISIPDLAAIQNNTHFLCTTFVQRLQSLRDVGELSPDLCEQYRQTNQAHLLTYFVPAYQNLGDSLLALYGSGQNEEGLCAFTHGKDYYTEYLAYSTGSSKSIPELKELLQQDFTVIYNEIRTLSRQVSFSEVSSDFSLTTPEEMMEVLIDCTENDFPPFPHSEDDITYTLKKVSPGLERFLSPAFYLTPQLDCVNENSIYINYGANPDSLTLFTTLAHEGYPGHLYQSVYYYLNVTNKQTSPVETILHYGGYVEGYATYAENLSYEYAKEYGSPVSIRLSQLTRNLQLCLYSLMDIAIHYDGMTLSDAHPVLASIGITDTHVVEEIYRYIASEPANYPKYYVGYLEILECKKLARENWGDAYSDYDFHCFLLDYGPADYPHIREAITTRRNLFS